MKQRLWTLDALRGLAVIGVVLGHYVGFPFGPWGVDMFFVLSGYLIGGILMDTVNQPGWAATFFMRRATRILPMYLILLLAMGCFKAPPLPIWHYLAFLQNFDMATSVWWPRYNAPSVTWSLAVEEQFYLLLPLAIRFLPKSAIPNLAVCGIVAAPLFRAVLVMLCHNVMAPYVLMPCRMDALFWGVLVAYWSRRERPMRYYRPLWVGCVVSAVGLVALGSTKGGLMLSFGVSFVDVCCAGLLVTAILVKGKQPSLASPFVEIGVRSYTVYLFHDLARALLPDEITALGATAVIAMVSWRLIEQPCLRLARSAQARAHPPLPVTSRQKSGQATTSHPPRMVHPGTARRA